MKKIISFLLCTAMLSTTLTVFADTETETTASPAEISSSEAPAETEQPAESETPTETEQPAESEIPAESEQPAESEAPEPTANPQLLEDKVIVKVTMLEVPNLTDAEVKFELYNSNNELLATQAHWVTRQTTSLTYTFDVPQYEIGEDFKLKLVDGLMGVQYNTTPYACGEEIPLETYTYEDEDGNIHRSNSLAVSGMPLFEKNISLKYDGNAVALTPAPRIIDGVTMVPIRQIAEHIGFNVSYSEEYNSVTVSLSDNYIFFNVGTAYTTVFGTDLYAPYPTTNIDGTIYVALRTLADAIGSELTVSDDFYNLNIEMGYSSYYQNYFDNIPVNKWGIGSRTNYMVWVSLSEYKVRLYQGQQGKWKPLLEAPCAIGAPGTPTVTGSFEYNYKTRWDYGTYYVGPCLVFYRGYALHSVLLYQNGTEYDGRTGVKISHGCVRLKKKDIDYIANTIPVGTRIYITP